MVKKDHGKAEDNEPGQPHFAHIEWSARIIAAAGGSLKVVGPEKHDENTCRRLDALGVIKNIHGEPKEKANADKQQVTDFNGQQQQPHHIDEIKGQVEKCELLE